MFVNLLNKFDQLMEKEVNSYLAVANTLLVQKQLRQARHALSLAHKGFMKIVLIVIRLEEKLPKDKVLSVLWEEIKKRVTEGEHNFLTIQENFNFSGARYLLNKYRLAVKNNRMDEATCYGKKIKNYMNWVVENHQSAISEGLEASIRYRDFYEQYKQIEKKHIKKITENLHFKPLNCSLLNSAFFPLQSQGKRLNQAGDSLNTFQKSF